MQNEEVFTTAFSNDFCRVAKALQI